MKLSRHLSGSEAARRRRREYGYRVVGFARTRPELAM